MDISIFEEKMNAFSFRSHQFVVEYHKTLESHGFAMNDVFEYVDFKKAENQRLEGILSSFANIMPKCPECGGNMVLRDVMLPKGRANIFGWRSCFECIAEGCTYEKYSTQRAQDIIKELAANAGL